MNWLRRLWMALRADADLAREIDAHVAESTDALIAGGLSPAEARAKARRAFGNLATTHEDSRAAWIPRLLTDLAQDARYAVRALCRRPSFTITSVAILAVGIGLVTVLAASVNARFLRPWDVPDPGRVVQLSPVPPPDRPYGSLSHPELLYLRAHSRTFVELASWMRGGAQAQLGDSGRDVQTNFVTWNYFSMLRQPVAAGRDFGPGDADPRAPQAVAIISDRLWRNTFGAPADIVGRVMHLRGVPFTVIGVMPPKFHDVHGFRIDVWMPLPASLLLFPGDGAQRAFADPNGPNYASAGRLRDDVTHEAAAAELSLLSRQFRETVPMAAYGMRLEGTRPIDSNPALSQQGPTVALTFAGFVLVMLVACSNVGNLILARGLTRRREIAIRLAIGAGRGRIVRQLLTEALMLAGAAGLIGFAIAMAVPRVMNWLDPDAMTDAERFDPNFPVLAIAVLLSALATLVAGLAPALRSTRHGIARGAGHRSSDQGGRERLRTVFLASQVALSCVLLVTAALLGRAIPQALSTDIGFTTANISVTGVQFPDGLDADQRATTFRAIGDTLVSRGLEVAQSDFPPITMAQMNFGFRLPGEERQLSRQLIVRPVSPTYFKVLQIPLIAGRTVRDDPDRSEIVVSAAAARLFWRDADPLGQRLISGNGDEPRQNHVVVGVARDVPVTSLSKVEPVVYWATNYVASNVIVRSAPGTTETIRDAVKSLSPTAAVTTRPLLDGVRESLRDLRVGSSVAWGVGALALALATVGAFGVFAFLVEQRRREIGVRMALGAQNLQVVRLVLAGAGRPLAWGLACGFVLASGIGILLRRTLYGLSPFDPISYLQVAAILTLAALIASWLPARRATKIDPIVALREE